MLSLARLQVVLVLAIAGIATAASHPFNLRDSADQDGDAYLNANLPDYFKEMVSFKVYRKILFTRLQLNSFDTLLLLAVIESVLS